MPQATLSPIPTVTRTPAPAPTATTRPTPAPHHLEIFQELWSIVQEAYLYPDFNGVDWGAVFDEVQIQVRAGLSDEAFYLAMDEMVARLGDGHSYYLDPAAAAAEDAEYDGDLAYVGIGLMSAPVPERGRAMVILTFPGSPAEQAGIAARDSILAVDGQPILTQDGFLRDVIRGPEGTSVELTVQSPGAGPRQVTVLRAPIRGPIPVPFGLLRTRTGLPVGYVLLPAFTDRQIPGQVEAALDELTRESLLHGLIVDNRWNYGGADTVMRATLRFFTDGLVGHFVSQDDRRPLRVTGEDIRGTQSLPLVVLIGPETASFGEVFAGVLQDLDRATLIGQTTAGNVEILWGYDFSDGSRAWIAQETFVPVNQPEPAWEAFGVVPDLAIQPILDPLPLEADPAVIAALDLLEGRAPE